MKKILNEKTANMTEINKRKEENNTRFSVLECSIKGIYSKLDILPDKFNK